MYIVYIMHTKVCHTYLARLNKVNEKTRRTTSPVRITRPDITEITIIAHCGICVVVAVLDSAKKYHIGLESPTPFWLTCYLL